MVKIIQMAKHYRKKPSEIVNINDPYLAYCFDECAFAIESEAITDKGDYNWKKIRFKDDEEAKQKTTNQSLIDFINKH
jgi:hypothetical protein